MGCIGGGEEEEMEEKVCSMRAAARASTTGGTCFATSSETTVTQSREGRVRPQNDTVVVRFTWSSFYLAMGRVQSSTDV